MTSDTAGVRRGAPWHLWLVAAVAILWNGYGGYDYVMSHLEGEAYYRQMGMTEAQIAFMASYPSWMHAVWAVGVWGSVAGSVLLMLRSRFAFPAFVLSFGGFLGSVAYAALAPGGMAAMGVAMPIIITAGCLFFIWYSQAMTKAGVLR